MNKSELHGARLVIDTRKAELVAFVDSEPLVGAVEGHDINLSVVHGERRLRVGGH